MEYNESFFQTTIKELDEHKFTFTFLKLKKLFVTRNRLFSMFGRMCS